MVEFFEVMFRALTGLKLTLPNLFSIGIFFALGYYFSNSLKNATPFKAVFVMIFGYFISSVLSGLLGVYTLAAVLGFISHRAVFLTQMALWAYDLTDLFFSLRNPKAFEDISAEEQRYEHPRAKERQYEQSHTKEQPRSKEQPQRQQSSSSQSKHAGWTTKKTKNQSDIERAFKILGLEPAEINTATKSDIKKAYRKEAMSAHPDLNGTGDTTQMTELSLAWKYLERFHF